MSKMEILKRTFDIIRIEISLANKHKNEGEIELYNAARRILNTELYFLLKIDIINYKQHEWLSNRILQDSQ